MASKSAIEVSPHDERLVEAVVARGLGALDELEAVIEAFDELGERIPGLGWMGLSDHYGYLGSCRRQLQTAEISRGRLGFALWYWYRVLLTNPIDEILGACEERQHGPFLEVERAVDALDPQLVAALNRGATYPALDDDQFAQTAGMTKELVESRGAAAISKLIESGWRP